MVSLQFCGISWKSGDLELEVDLSLRDGLLVAITGPNGSGKKALLEIAGGLREPQHGEIVYSGRLEIALRSFDSVDTEQICQSINHALSPRPDVLLIGPGFALVDPVYQANTLVAIGTARRSGTLTLLISHDFTLALQHCDEVLLMDRGRIIDHGDPQIVLEGYRAKIDESRGAESRPPPVDSSSRYGDGRAEIMELQIIDSSRKPVGLIRTGEAISVRVRVRYLKAVTDPVIGMLIRSRIGVNVYGTNTELENLSIGSCAAGDEIELHFHFNANLCAQDYTLTVASHDPNGIAHEWLEDAIAFTISDTRYTAGVADLRAQVDIKRLNQTEETHDA